MTSVEFVRVAVDPDGNSYFARDEAPLAPTDYAPPAPLVGVSPAVPALATAFLSVPPGWFGDYHPAPRRQWIFVLGGEAELQVSDGERRTFGPGSILLVEDIEGQGHTTRALGETPLLLAAVPIANG